MKNSVGEFYSPTLFIVEPNNISRSNEKHQTMFGVLYALNFPNKLHSKLTF